MKTLKSFATAVLALFFLFGCQSLKNQDTGLNLAINIAVMKAIEAEDEPRLRDERAQRFIELTGLALAMLDDQDAVIGVVYERVMNEIRWEKLSPSDQMMLRMLINQTALSVQERIEAKLIDADKVTTVKTAVTWVQQAAKSYRQALAS